MNYQNLKFRAEGKILRRLESTDLVKENDYIEWVPNDWVRIEYGSPMIGKPPEISLRGLFLNVIRIEGSN